MKRTLFFLLLFLPIQLFAQYEIRIDSLNATIKIDVVFDSIASAPEPSDTIPEPPTNNPPPIVTESKLVKYQSGEYLKKNGMIVYYPVNYDDSKKYPLLIALHGTGETGEGTSKDLDKLLKTGIGKWIVSDREKADEHLKEFIVWIPQTTWNHRHWSKWIIDYMIPAAANDPAIDNKRIYLTGYSAGAYGVRTACFESPAAKKYVAAAVPISGTWAHHISKSNQVTNIPLWFFNGSNDNTPNPAIDAINFVKSYNSHNPDEKARVTIYPGVGHNAWDMTYNLSGMNRSTDGKYDPYDVNIYDWLLQFKRE